jgi:hypothetical protein
MIKKLFLIFLSLVSVSLAAQKRKALTEQSMAKAVAKENASDTITQAEAPKATIDMYRVITLERDTTYIDTTLDIHKDYIFNYLRKDNFGLLPFANDGQTYNTLDFGLNDFSPYPEFGFKAKHFNYLQVRDMKYYAVATPLTELYFKTTIKQGQSLDAFITVNTSERLNFSIAYKGLRSLGRYANQLSSTGNFRFTTSYNTKDKRYFLKAHFTAQDMLNGENGGIVNNSDFESGDIDFKDRARLQVYFNDAESLLKGNRYFIDQRFRFNKTEGENNLYFTHQFNFENKFFEYAQPTVATIILGETTNDTIQRLGPSYLTSNIKNKTRYNRMYNKIGAVYENKTLGEFQVFIEDFKYNYYYNSIIVNDDNIIPSSLNDRINTFGGQYTYQKNKWNGTALFSNSISDQDLSNLDLSLNYRINEDNQLSFRYQKINKLPDLNYNLYQSGYIDYNWHNDFKNEKINNIEVKADTKWGNASLQLTTLNDHLYFSNDDPALLIVSPKQYRNTINYLSLKVGKEFRLWKFAIDNTVLYQKTDQNDNILNVPQIVTRNTLYFSDYVFKRAMFIQTGITLNYFTKYYANEYNPLLGEFYVQDQKEIGDFPMLDFFLNAKVRQTRIYLKAEHFNSLFGKNNFYSSPGYPYRDFLIRFGLVWNFFQ